MEKKKLVSLLLWIIFIVALILTAIFTTKTGLHDADEYINVAKELSGIHNVKVFSAHSIVYPLFIAQFLKIFPSLITIKLIGILWFILTGILLYFILKSKKAFLIWMFSPLVWINIAEVSPILPIAFFALLSYLYFKKWEESNKKSYFAISALSLGLCFTLWEAFVINFILFILIFFWNKKFKITFLYFILTLPTIAISVMVDKIYFDLPFTSILRYISANISVMVGYTNPWIFNPWIIPVTIFLIAPLLFMLYKTNFKKYWREFLFIILLLIFFMIRGGVGPSISSLKYYLPFAPILIFILAKTLNKKLLLINSVASIILIIVLVFGIFSTNAAILQNCSQVEPGDISYIDCNIKKDITQFKKDFDFKEVIAGRDQALVFATHSWSDEPNFIWWKEYKLSKENEEYFNKQAIQTNPKINQLKILEIQVGLKRTDDRTFEDLPIITIKDVKNQTIPKGYKLIKEYNLLQVYTK